MKDKKVTPVKAETKKPFSVIGQFVGKCCDANVVNNNDMHLGEQLFKNLFASEEYKRAMKNRHYIGFLGHPADIDCMDFEHGCIVMTDCKLEDNGEVTGTFDLIDTPVGQVVKAFIDAGVKFGISIRGAGDITGEEVDPDTFVFRGFDLVTFPAYNDCIPEFREIAASTDSKKQKAYKKVCAAINSQLKNINSSEALEVIREQFVPDSEEYGIVSDRIAELAAPTEDADNTVQEVAMQVLEQKVDALTNLYVDAQQKISDLEQDIVEVSNSKEEELVAAKTELKHYKRITANQLRDAKESLQEEITANDKLNSQLRDIRGKLVAARQEIKSAQQTNLKYQRKIEAHSNVLTEKDSAIEEVKSQLHETVVAKTELSRKVASLSDENEQLRSRVEASEKALLEYQKAYANIYANALGRHISNLTVNSATSVKDLQEMISSTNTGNIAAAPSFEEEEFIEGDDFIEDELNDDEVEGYNAGLVSM